MPERVTLITVMRPNSPSLQVATKKRAREVVEALEVAANSSRGIWLTNLHGYEDYLTPASVQHIAEVAEIEGMSPEEQRELQDQEQRRRDSMMRQAALAGGPPLLLRPAP
jgi:hypothetical protein